MRIHYAETHPELPLTVVLDDTGVLGLFNASDCLINPLSRLNAIPRPTAASGFCMLLPVLVLRFCVLFLDASSRGAIRCACSHFAVRLRKAPTARLRFLAGVTP